MLLATIHREGKGSMFFALPVAVRIFVAIREQYARGSPGLDEAWNAARGGLVQDTKYGIAEQTVTATPVAALCTAGEST